MIHPARSVVGSTSGSSAFAVRVGLKNDAGRCGEFFLRKVTQLVPFCPYHGDGFSSGSDFHHTQRWTKEWCARCEGKCWLSSWGDVKSVEMRVRKYFKSLSCCSSLSRSSWNISVCFFFSVHRPQRPRPDRSSGSTPLQS